MPSQAAWTSFLRAVSRAGIQMDDALYDAVFGSLVAQHHWGVDVSKVLAGGPAAGFLLTAWRTSARGVPNASGALC